MEYLASFLTIGLIHVLAVASPGPDFIMITRSSLAYSRKIGIFSALGLGFGCLIHYCYCLLGLGVIISQSIVLFSMIKLLGAAYLLYLGIKIIRYGSEPIVLDADPSERSSMQPKQAVTMGVLTNVLNPKCALYFLSLFTQVIDPETPTWIYGMYGLEVFSITVIWFSVLAVMLSHNTIRAGFSRVQRSVEKVLGVALVLFGVKLALTCNDD